MNPATFKLHEQLLRHATGMLAAWRNWLEKQVVDDPDPVEHFREKADALAKRNSTRAE